MKYLVILTISYFVIACEANFKYFNFAFSSIAFAQGEGHSGGGVSDPSDSGSGGTSGSDSNDGSGGDSDGGSFGETSPYGSGVGAPPGAVDSPSGTQNGSGISPDDPNAGSTSDSGGVASDEEKSRVVGAVLQAGLIIEGISVKSRALYGKIQEALSQMTDEQLEDFQAEVDGIMDEMQNDINNPIDNMESTIDPDPDPATGMPPERSELEI